MDFIDPHAPNATIIRRRDLNHRVAIVHVRPDSGSIQEFVPGQFVQLGLPVETDAARSPGDPPKRTKLVKRSYSIASSPQEHDAYELCIAFVDQGQLTPKLKPLTVGARIWHDAQPKGFFTMEKVPDGRDLVFVATGTGIAPFVSMLRLYRTVPNRFQSFVVVHGARESSDLAYHEELAALARVDERVRYVPVLSREPEASGWSGLRGRVQIALEEARLAAHARVALDPANTHVFLCGNPDMIQAVRDLLTPRGFVADTVKVPGNLHFERYW